MTLPVAAWRVTYTPGNWLVFSGPTMLVVMPPAPADASELVGELWRDIVSTTSADALLRLVGGVGLDAMPDLGAFFWDDDALHGLTRGSVRVVDVPTGEVVLEGAGAVLWHEAALGTVRQLRIDLEPATDDEVLRLPLVVGAVSASSIQLSTDPETLLRFPASGQPGELVGVPPLVSDGDAQPSDEPAEPEPAPEPQQPEPEAAEEEPTADPATLQFPGLGDEFALDGATDPGPGTGAPSEPEEPFVAVVPEPVPEPPAAQRPAPVVVPPRLGEIEDEPGTVFSTGLAATHKPAPPAADPRDAQVLAVPCANSHANPPGSRSCRICGAPVDSSNPRLIRRPVLAGVHTNGGDFVDIVEGVVIGRAPAADHGPAGAHLLRVPSPSSDISRNHLLVTTRDWGVHVTDLQSTNGTTVLPTGEAPFTLRDGASVQVELGTVLDLGDGVSLRIEPPRG